MRVYGVQNSEFAEKLANDFEENEVIYGSNFKCSVGELEKQVKTFLKRKQIKNFWVEGTIDDFDYYMYKLFNKKFKLYWGCKFTGFKVKV